MNSGIMIAGGFAFVIAGLLVGLGLILGVVFAPFLIRQFSKIFTVFIWPEQHDSVVHPSYDRAKGLVIQGRYAEALDQYLEFSRQFPDEITPHIQMADLYLEHCQNPRAAMGELRKALTKTSHPESFSLISFRVADLCVQHAGDLKVALECLKEVQRKFPGSKHARYALKRAENLMETIQREKRMVIGTEAFHS